MSRFLSRLSLVLFLVTVFGTFTKAQWRLELSGGANINHHQCEQGYAYDRKFSPDVGFNFALASQYNFYDWIGLKFALYGIQRSYKLNTTILSDAYQYKNLYALVPILVSFSFGGKQIRGFCNLGGYAGYWLSGHYNYNISTLNYISDRMEGKEKIRFNNKRDRRIDAGLAAQLGIQYVNSKTNIFISLGTFMYYGLVNSHKATSKYFKQPAFDSNIGFELGIGYLFKQNNKLVKGNQNDNSL